MDEDVASNVYAVWHWSVVVFVRIVHKALLSGPINSIWRRAVPTSRTDMALKHEPIILECLKDL